jgi:hypothetical protein
MVVPDVPTVTLLVQAAQFVAQLFSLRGSRYGDREEITAQLATINRLLFSELIFLEQVRQDAAQFQSAMTVGLQRMRRTHAPTRIRIHHDGVTKWFRIHITDSMIRRLESRRREMDKLPQFEGVYDTPFGDALALAVGRYARMVEAVRKFNAVFPDRFQQLLVERTPSNYNDFVFEANSLLIDIRDFETEARMALIQVGDMATQLFQEGT